MLKKAWLISVNMGYGHQRTAYPLKALAWEDKIINANDYPDIPAKDRKTWETMRHFYEFISGLKRFPLIGEAAFSLYDKFQEILSFYPKRDLSRPNFQLRQIFRLMKKGWGRDLIEVLKSKNSNLPFISTFFVPAFMAEYFEYPSEIYCVICDADISRTWVSLFPRKSRIKYLASTPRVVERLKLYGVKKENIFLTGFPLPLENITLNPSSGRLEILKKDLLSRLFNLDPKKRCQYYYGVLMKKYLGSLPQASDHPLTLMFSIGGAGAQKELGVKILNSLKKNLKKGDLKIVLAIGNKEKVKKYFERNLKKLGLKEGLGKEVEIVFEKNIDTYFQKFNKFLRKTDVLWTKPSELSFYAALGLPIIIAPFIGSQEDFNRRWLLKSGFGNLQEDPLHAKEWLFDWLSQGYLAEACLQGFIEGEKLGAFNIQKIIEK